MNSLINNNLYIDNNIFNKIEKNNSEIQLLNKKRNFDQSLFGGSFNNIIPKKEVDFILPKKIELKNEVNESSTDQDGLTNLSIPSEQFVFNNNKNCNSEMQKLFEIEKLFKKLININYKNNFELQNQKTKDKAELNIVKEQPIINNQKVEKINSPPVLNDESSKINDVNSNQNNIFNITNIGCNCNGDVEKKREKLENDDKKNCHEIKVLKNNKVVYINTNWFNLFSTTKNLKKPNKITFIGKGKRGSKYRGVSRNGNQWQVLIMLHKSKSYVGTYSTEEIAARIYDILAIKNRGIKARTNFIYNEQQIKNILNTNIDIKAKNINEIVNNLLKEETINSNT